MPLLCVFQSTLFLCVIQKTFSNAPGCFVNTISCTTPKCRTVVNRGNFHDNFSVKGAIVATPLRNGLPIYLLFTFWVEVSPFQQIVYFRPCTVYSNQIMGPTPKKALKMKLKNTSECFSAPKRVKINVFICLDDVKWVKFI